MPREFTSEEWRGILRLAQEASTIAKSDRPLYLESQNTDADIIAEALDLAHQFELKPDEPLGRAHTTIGRFELLDYLGSGGSGEVYTANDPELGRQVAIKIFRSDVNTSRSGQQRFIREARAASALNHPNIVTIYEIVRSDTRVAIVMEVVPGEPLRKLCATGVVVEPKIILAVGNQVAEALSAAHSAGIVHRDIKPENIMLLPDSRVKVLDFGLARRTDNAATATSHTLHGGIPGGTLRYMSPEHFRAQPISSKSDIFALGLVLCELASGQHPFTRGAAANPFDIFHAIGTEELPRNFFSGSSLPPLFESTVRAMLSADPALRPTAGEVATAFRECAVELSAANNRAVAGRSGSWRWTAVLAVIVVAVAAGLLIWFRQLDSAQYRTLRRVTQLVPENRATASAISQDGKFVSYANSDGIFLESLDNEETTILNSPPELLVDTIAWMADGTKLIVSGFSDEKSEPEIWSVPTNGGVSRELQTGLHFGTPSPDGSRIAFASRDYSSIGVMDSDGQDATTLLELPSKDSIHSLLWSSDGRYILMQRRHLSAGLEYLQESDQRGVTWILDAFDLRKRKIAGSRTNSPDRQLLSIASFPDDTIGFIASGDRDPIGHQVLSSIRLDSASGRISSSTQPLSGHNLFGDLTSFGLSVTADGAKIAFLRQTREESIFVADFNRAALHFSNFQRLTLTTSPSYPHAWTSDSRQVIFESDRTGTYDLYKQPVNRRLPQSILATAKRWEYLPQLTPDGKYILFASTSTGLRPFTLMRIAANGGITEEVPAGGPLDEFRCSVRPQGRCVLRQTHGRSEFVYYELDPIRGIGRELARTAWLPPLLGDWDVSPDGKFIVIPLHDRRSGNLRIVSLEAKDKEPKQRDVALTGLTQLLCAAWAVDGTGWFVSADTTVGGRMYFSDLHGRLTPLGDISSCAVPSPDGRTIAYHHNVMDSNVWIMTAK